MPKLMIGICDDEEIIRNALKELVEKTVQAASAELEYEVWTFSSGEALLAQIHQLELVFLDIDMPGMDGIETGRQIQNLHPDCRIVMATSMVERFKEAFQIQAFRFVTKPFEVSEIEEAIRGCLSQKIGQETIQVYLDRNPYELKQKEICYISAYGSYVEIRAQGKLFRKEGSLEEMEEIMEPKLFFRVHRKYLVNMFWIENYKNGVIFLENQEIPVSRRRKKEFEHAYLEFDLHYRR
ncbi:MAG: response regulator transcription factor [Lachnospiraceae bacterium]|nr:response regulator transcription factor [Lachnospiraceae bacterium]